MTGVPAAEYHDRTKQSPASVRESRFRLDFENKPIPYKIYTDRDAQSLPADIDAIDRPALAAIAEPDPTPQCDGDVGPLDRRGVATLCQLGVGVTKQFGGGSFDLDPVTASRERLLHAVQPLYHAAACTGKLYHVDCYLVCGDLPELSAGVYHVDPLGRALDVLRVGDFRGVVAEAAGDHHGVSAAPLLVVATSTWWRNAWKYRARTYRHAFWDSGTVIANVLAAAHGQGHRAEVVTGFADDTIASLLGIDPTTEAPLELVAVGAGDVAPDPRALPALDVDTRQLSPDPIEYPLVHGAWRAGSLPDGQAARSWRDADPVQTRDRGEGKAVELAPEGSGDAPSVGVSRTIRRRGSCRSYRREPVPFRTVSTVLDRAIRGLPFDVGTDDPLSFTDSYLIATGVDGLAGGTYHLHPDDGVLERLREGEFRREAGHLALDQELGADAAASIYLLADVDAVTDALGDRGYRVAQLEAAVTAGRLYLATYAHEDLGGTGLTFYDDAVSAFFSPRAEGQQPMFLYTLGRPA